MTGSIRRNDPCPCGSGRRYKECHGSLAAGRADGFAAILERALASHRRGAIDEAARGYAQVLALVPGHAVATHYLGMVAWQRGDVVAAEEALRASIAADDSVADFHNNLGLLLRDTGRADEAVAAFRRALTADPAWAEAFNNLALALEDLGRCDEAREAYAGAIGRAPAFAAAHQNLARVLLTQGEFAAGWHHYRWRLLAQGLATTPPGMSESSLAGVQAGRRIALMSEQGIGDVLFFLRFAPMLARRGVVLAFRGDTRLHPMLARTGLFQGGLGAPGAGAPGFEPAFVGDLPLLLGADDSAALPPPLPLAPAPGPSPGFMDAVAPGFKALAWRGGVQSTGPARTRLKEIAPEALGSALRGRAGPWVSIQRHPRPEERERLEEALGAPVADWSAANEDLEAMLHVLAAAAALVGVSNANTHLRAGLGGPSTVLVPFPPEWRWGMAGERSPWFPGARVVRQRPDGEWDLAALAT